MPIDPWVVNQINFESKMEDTEKQLKRLMKENKELNEVVKDRTGDVIHLYEENKQLREKLDNIKENEIKYLEKGIKLAMEHTYDDDTHEFLDRLLKHDTTDVPAYRLKIE